MAITAQKLMVEVEADTSGAQRDLNQFSDTGTKSFGWVAAAKAALVGFAGAAAVSFGGKAIMAASDLNETISKTGEVFGEETSRVTGYAQDMADQFGLPKTAILDAASSFGLLADASGLATDASADMSTQLAGLAADASSFYNVPLEEALAAIQSGLVGEAEPMRRFGVLMNEAAVQAEALRLGIWDGNGAMTEAQKVQARSSLIMAGMTKASGDLERTQGSVSNRIRELQGRIVNWAADMGTKALPAVETLLAGVIAFGTGLGDAAGWISEHRTALAVAAGVITAVFLPAMIRAGVTSVVSTAQIVAGWVAQQVAAIASAAAQWGAFVRVVAGWVMAGAAAVRSGAQTVAVWAMYQAAAIRGAAASVAAHGRIVAGWVAAGAAAAAGAARTVAGWVLAGATAMAQGAVMVASMAATAASVVAGWVLMAVQSLAQAARMAAAWLIAMGPVGWVIAAVVALVALIIANWDTVSKYTAQAWDAIVGWVTSAWEAIVSWVTTAVNKVKAVVSAVFTAIGVAIRTYLNAWQTIIRTVWAAIVAIVTTYINTILAVIGGLASIGGKVRGWFDQARQGIAQTMSAAIEFVRGVPGKIVAALGNVGRLLYDSGAKIMQGLADGIKGAVRKATDAVSGAMASVRDFLPFSPAKRGPFSGRGWSGYSGASIARDMAEGIAKNTNLVKRSALGLARAAAMPLPGVQPGGSSVGFAGTTDTGARATAHAAMGLPLPGSGGGATTLVFVDQDGALIGRMQAEAGRVATGQVTPLDQGRAKW